MRMILVRSSSSFIFKVCSHLFAAASNTWSLVNVSGELPPGFPSTSSELTSSFFLGTYAHSTYLVDSTMFVVGGYFIGAVESSTVYYIDLGNELWGCGSGREPGDFPDTSAANPVWKKLETAPGAHPDGRGAASMGGTR